MGGTGHLHAVGKDRNPAYHTLISAFAEKTGTPVVLNTSVNENEPIVESPEQALDCFFRTAMDVVVVKNTLVMREPVEATAADEAAHNSAELLLALVRVDARLRDDSESTQDGAV